MIKVEPKGLSGDAFNEAVEEDISKFDAYFQGNLKNSPLVASEHAILKTYLWYKMTEEKDGN